MKYSCGELKNIISESELDPILKISFCKWSRFLRKISKSMVYWILLQTGAHLSIMMVFLDHFCLK